MEHFESPFGRIELQGPHVARNRAFLRDTLIRTKRQRFYAHSFLAAFQEAPSREVVSFVLTSFYKVVSPFTGHLCALGGRAPDLRTRFALMDNIYEEMGCGDLTRAHPNLYLRMLASIGIDGETAERTPPLAAVGRINDHLRAVVERCPFSVACAVFSSAEATIPLSFSTLARGAQRAFDCLDSSFFDRHGPRDDGHAEDATMLFAVTADPSHFSAVEREVNLDLELRSQLFDEWTARMGPLGG